MKIHITTYIKDQANHSTRQTFPGCAFQFPTVSVWSSLLHSSDQQLCFVCLYKKAVLSQRWPRDACYISRSWAVAEIWPFKIIQDGSGRHLEFVRIENSAIRSAVPEKPTLEPNMWWIGSPVVEISPLEIFPTWRWPPSWICSNRK